MIMLPWIYFGLSSLILACCTTPWPSKMQTVKCSITGNLPVNFDRTWRVITLEILQVHNKAVTNMQQMQSYKKTRWIPENLWTSQYFTYSTMNGRKLILVYYWYTYHSFTLVVTMVIATWKISNIIILKLILKNNHISKRVDLLNLILCVWIPQNTLCLPPSPPPPASCPLKFGIN